jgi:flagellar hook-associated protein 1 FlgK
MPTLGSLSNLAQAALSADQIALNATAANVANQNTVGYTRQVASFQFGDTVTISGSTETGVPTVSVSSQRDRVLEQRVQQQTQAQSASSAESSVLNQVQAVFSLTSTSTTVATTPIGTALDSLFGSFTALAAAPSDATAKQAVLSAANTLADSINSASSQLRQIGTSIGTQLTTTVAQVNKLTKTIATLNGQIAQQSPNADAGALEDQRQAAITQLSGLIGLDQISTENNGITLTTGDGTTLVSGNTNSAISVGNNGSGYTVEDASGNDISTGIQGGSIGGLLTAQSVDLPQVTSALDTLAYNLGTAINTQNEAGTTSAGVSGQAIFSLPSSSAGAAAAISVAATSVTAIASAGSGEGTSGNSNALALAAIATTTDSSGQTFADTYAALLGEVGSTASTVAQQSTTQQTSLTALTSQRNSFSAVSLDEEAANLTEYQRSYQAAAKLFSIIDTLTASALNLGEPTTVS